MPPADEHLVAHCPMCEAWRETTRLLADELQVQRAMTLKVAERLYVCSQHLGVVAERKDRRKA